MKRKRTLIAVVALLFAVGCEKSGDRESKAKDTSATAGASDHAPADVEPGSHADWCGEHGVLESQCTRCNPELAAAFKATGDWCDKHGLPESQCKKCNPDLEIIRPPAPDNKVK